MQQLLAICFIILNFCSQIFCQISALSNDFSKGKGILSSGYFKGYDTILVVPERYSAKAGLEFIGRQEIQQVLNSSLGALGDTFRQTQTAMINNNSFHQFALKSVLNERNHGRTALFLFPSDKASFVSLVRIVATLYAEEPGKNFDTRLFTFFVWPEITKKSDVSSKSQSLLHPLTEDFRINTEVFVLFQTEQAGDNTLVEFYSIRGVSIVQSVSNCWSSVTWDCYILARRYIRRKNFQGGVVKITAVDHIWDLCVTSYTRTNGTLEFSGGISVVTIWGIQDALNFTIFAMDSLGYIALVSDGSLIGVGGQVYKSQADLSITLEYLLEDRVGRITPLFPIFIDTVRAYFQPPVELKNFYSSPFSLSVWAVIAGISVLTLILACLLTKLGSGLHERSWYSAESLLFVSIILSQKGWYFDPPCLPGRVLLLTTLCLSVLCFTAYSGSIISTLAVNIIPVKSFNDLIKHGFRLMFYPDHNYLFSQKSETGVGNVENNGFDSDDHAVTRTITGGFIFLTTTDVFRPLSRRFVLHERFCSSVSSIHFEKAPLQNGFYVRKGSPIKDSFNVRILQSLEAGLSIRYKREQLDKEIVECPAAKSQQHTLEMREVSTAFLIFLAGSGSALLILLSEVFYKSKLKHLTEIT